MIKKRLMPVLFLACVLFLGACNESVITDVEDPVTVTFNVSTLNVDTQPMSRAAANSGADLSEVVNTIGYYIYGSNSSLYKSGETSFVPDVDPIPENFGEVKEVIQPGTYTIIFYAYGKGGGTADWSETSVYGSTTALNFTDKEIFYYCESVEITAGNNVVEIPMTRNSALLIINILDEATDEVSKVEYKFTNNKYWLPYYGRTGGTQQLTYEASISNKKLETFEYYFPFPSSTVSLTFNIYDLSSTIIGTKTLTIPLEANKKTIVSGELFSSLGEKGFTILLEDAWDEDIEFPFQ